MNGQKLVFARLIVLSGMWVRYGVAFRSLPPLLVRRPALPRRFTSTMNSAGSVFPTPMNDTATATIVSSGSSRTGSSNDERRLLGELRQRIDEAPEKPGVYLFRDRDQRLLYVGKSVKLRQRIRSYFRGLQQSPEDPPSPARSLGRRQAVMVSLIRHLEVVVTTTANDALVLEASLVNAEQPPFNVQLKDDKQTYPYLCVTWSQTYPEIFVTRRRTTTRGGKGQNKRSRSGSEENVDRYLGPFVDSHQLRTTLALIKSVFPLRQRFRPLHADKPCLNYDIGRCPGVCQALISPEDYRQTVLEAQMVFEGRGDALIPRLERRMKDAAVNEAFERAEALQVGCLPFHASMLPCSRASTCPHLQAVIFCLWIYGYACAHALFLFCRHRSSASRAATCLGLPSTSIRVTA